MGGERQTNYEQLDSKYEVTIEEICEVVITMNATRQTGEMVAGLLWTRCKTAREKISELCRNCD